MSARYSSVYGPIFTYEFWLIFAEDGSLRMSRGEPSIGRGERAMSCKASLPRTLFTIPELKATIDLTDSAPGDFTIDVQAAGEALRQVIGCDVDLQIRDTRE